MAVEIARDVRWFRVRVWSVRTRKAKIYSILAPDMGAAYDVVETLMDDGDMVMQMTED